MKKALFTTIILCAVAITSSAQELPWFWHENDYALKGHVKEVREYHIEMRGDPELQDTDYYFYTYTPDGHILTEYFDDVDKLCHNTYYWSTHLDSIVRDGDCHSIDYYLYDADGRLERVIHGVYGLTDTTAKQTSPGMNGMTTGVSKGLAQNIGANCMSTTAWAG